jgi:hypothetical protein
MTCSESNFDGYRPQRPPRPSLTGHPPLPQSTARRTLQPEDQRHSPPPRRAPLDLNSDSHTRPSSSTTIPVALLAASAAARFANLRICQYACRFGNCRLSSEATLKQPKSGLFSLGDARHVAKVFVRRAGIFLAVCDTQSNRYRRRRSENAKKGSPL